MKQRADSLLVVSSVALALAIMSFATFDYAGRWWIAAVVAVLLTLFMWQVTFQVCLLLVPISESSSPLSSSSSS